MQLGGHGSVVVVPEADQPAGTHLTAEGEGDRLFDRRLTQRILHSQRHKAVGQGKTVGEEAEGGLGRVLQQKAISTDLVGVSESTVDILILSHLECQLGRISRDFQASRDVSKDRGSRRAVDRFVVLSQRHGTTGLDCSAL